MWVRVLDCMSPGFNLVMDLISLHGCLCLPRGTGSWMLRRRSSRGPRTVSDHVQRPERKDAVTMMGYYCRLHEKCPHRITRCTWSPAGSVVQGSYRMLGPAEVHYRGWASRICSLTHFLIHFSASCAWKRMQVPSFLLLLPHHS